MDQGSVGMFKDTNMSIARVYWYLIAATVGLLSCRQLVDRARLLLLQRRSQRPRSLIVPPRLETVFLQVYDTTITVCRELAYPQIYWHTGKFGRYLNPPPLGRCLVLLAYWVMILTMLWSNVILKPASPIYAYKWEIVGFRAAWVSITQVPLVYCLSCKFNIITLLTGISYERMNWLHRWVSRTLFFTIIVHWSFFFREWWLADFVQFEIAAMPMVKYGFGAWAVIGWMVITGFGFFRQIAYEVWVLQHVLAAYVLLWLLYCHIPDYARYNLWLAIGFVALDRGTRVILSLANNLHFRSSFHNLWTGPGPRLGFESQVTALPHGYLHLTVKDVDFSWQPGQHAFISIPRYGVADSHPFTIANECISNPNRKVEFYIKVHSGLTWKLYNHAQKRSETPLRTFLSGPWGSPPMMSIASCDSLILLATSTGASFTVPHLLHTINTSPMVRKVRFFWIMRYTSQFDWFDQEIYSAIKVAISKGVDIRCHIYVTGDPAHTEIAEDLGPDVIPDPMSKVHIEEKEREETRNPTGVSERIDDSSLSSSSSSSGISATLLKSTDLSMTKKHLIDFARGRPISLDPLIRPTVEDAGGETVILACGGPQFMSQVRNYTAALSDDRAVHKGSGAHGIQLFTETYGW